MCCINQCLYKLLSYQEEENAETRELNTICDNVVSYMERVRIYNK